MFPRLNSQPWAGLDLGGFNPTGACAGSLRALAQGRPKGGPHRAGGPVYVINGKTVSGESASQCIEVYWGGLGTAHELGKQSRLLAR